MQLGHEEPGINRLVKEVGLRRQIAAVRLYTSRHNKNRRCRPLKVRPPRKVISVERTGHFHVRDEGVDSDVADACDPIVGGTNFNYLKACVPKGAACKPPGSRVVLDEEYARRVFLSLHGAAIVMAKGQFLCVGQPYVAAVS